MTSKKILIVDDEATNLQLLKGVLENDYQLSFAKNGRKALELASAQLPDLILLDIMMPDFTGYDVLAELKNNAKTRHIPVIFVTAMSEFEDEGYGLNLGAVDYITKPVNPAIVKSRIKTHLSLVRLDELNETRLEIIRRLGHAAEFKDNETGLHVIRMSHYSKIIAIEAGMTSEDVEQILNAAPMHDIGKIGIPDSILLKPGKLDPHEMEVMRKHPEIGAKIIGEHNSPLLKLAANIAYTHHEKWNGSGYPRQLQGEDIPLEGRIVAIADVFDALTTKRPYKKAWEVSAAVDYIKRESGQHFDPDLVRCFLNNMDAIMDVKQQWQEED